MKYRSASVFVRETCAGRLYETEEGYEFQYLDVYLNEAESSPISLTMPLQREKYFSKTLFSFFDGLIPEGWLFDVVTHNWKLDPNDRFGILLVACKDPIGNVMIKEDNE